MRMWDKRGWGVCFYSSLNWIPIRYPFRVAAIQYSSFLMTYPAEHPPQPGGKTSTRRIVHDYLLIFIDTPRRKCMHPGIQIWKGVPAYIWADRSGQIPVEMRVYRSWNVTGLVVDETPPGITEIKSA